MDISTFLNSGAEALATGGTISFGAILLALCIPCVWDIYFIYI